MKTYDCYNALTHQEYLPVCVLGYNFIDSFLNVTPDFQNEFDYDVNSNYLKKSIKYNIIRKPINDITHITVN